MLDMVQCIDKVVDVLVVVQRRVLLLWGGLCGWRKNFAYFLRDVNEPLVSGSLLCLGEALRTWQSLVRRVSLRQLLKEFQSLRCWSCPSRSHMKMWTLLPRALREDLCLVLFVVHGL